MDQPCPVCPVCGSPPLMIIGPTQAICSDVTNCRVIAWNPSLPDGGASSPHFVTLDSE